MAISTINIYREMMMSIQQQLQQRMIHALCYELILLVVGAPLLSLFLHENLTDTGILWIMMSLTAMIWNMLFNHFFEKLEQFFQWTKRTIAIRVLHAITFEGALLILTVPMIAWMLDLSIWKALMLDIGLAICITGYTFVYQWCYDLICARYFKLDLQK